MAIKTYTLTRISPFTAAKLNALIVGSLGVLTSLWQILDGTYSYLTTVTAGDMNLSYFKFLGALALQGIVTVVVGAIVGLILGLVVSLVYNWWVKFAGGVKVELDEIE